MDAHLPGTPRERADVVVVGGGIGGLLAAITAASSSEGSRRRIIVLEPHGAGGRARCDTRSGYVFNRGPRALYAGGIAETTLTRLGVSIAGAPPTLGNAVAVLDGTLHRFPTGPIASTVTTLLDARQKVAVTRALAAIMRATPTTAPGLSVAQWLDARKLVGPSRQLVEALVRVSTYTNAPDLLAAGAGLTNARVGVHPGVRYLDGGWQSIVDQLLLKASGLGIEIRPVAASAIERRGGGVAVTTADGIIEASAVAIAAGLPSAAAGLLGGTPPSWPALGPPVTAACLELGVRTPPHHRFVLGIDEPTYASTHCPPARLAPEGHAVVHVMRYQPPGDDLSAEDQRAVLDRTAALAGVAPRDIVEERFLARMVVTGALPTAAGGLAGRAPVQVADHLGVHLVGDWVGPDGMLLDAVAASAVDAGARCAAAAATMVTA